MGTETSAPPPASNQGPGQNLALTGRRTPSYATADDMPIAGPISRSTPGTGHHESSQIASAGPDPTRLADNDPARWPGRAQRSLNMRAARGPSSCGLPGDQIRTYADGTSHRYEE